MPQEEVVQIVGPVSPSWSIWWAKSLSDSALIQGDHKNCQFLVQCKKFRKCALTFMPREDVVQIVSPVPPSWSHWWAKSPSDSVPIQGDHKNYQFLVRCKKFRKCALMSNFYAKGGSCPDCWPHDSIFVPFVSQKSLWLCTETGWPPNLQISGPM